MDVASVDFAVGFTAEITTRSGEGDPEMARRAFDRYMVAIGMGTHPKFAQLTDSEFRAHVVGILAIAAMAPIRGYLLVGNLPAQPINVALTAGVSERVARSAMDKLEAVGVLRRDENLGCFEVHDWNDINPPPGSSAERMRRYRAKLRDANGDVSDGESVTETSHSPSPEVEVEVKPASTTSQQVARKRATNRVDQDVLPADFNTELAETVQRVLPILDGAWEIRGGIRPQLRGVGSAVMRNEQCDHVAVAHRLQHWLLSGTGQRARCKDVTARFGDWVAEETAGKAPLHVVGRESASDLLRAINEEAS